MSKKSYLDIRGEWYCGDSFKVTLTADMLPADNLVCEIERRIKSLRSLYYEFVIVDLQDGDRTDSEYPVYFQTLRNRSYGKTNTYRIELGMKIDRGTIHYLKDEVSLSELLELFRKICVCRENPKIHDWDVETDIYDDKETAEEDTTRAKELKRYEIFVSNCWQNHIQGQGIDFAEYEAMEYLAENDCDPIYQGTLAREYEKRGLYKTLRALFDTISHNPVIAQINGEMELHGIFGKPNYKKAFDYFIHAMKIGSLLAEYSIAKMYKYGLYVKKNYAKYESMIRSVYRKYKENIIEACPIPISLEMSKVEEQSGNDDMAIECCCRALKTQKMLMIYGLGNVTSDDADIVRQLYKLVYFDPDDMDLLDLLYVLQRPCTARIMLNGEQITICSYYNQGKLIVKCGSNYYRDAVDFLKNHKVKDTFLTTHIYDIDNMEIE